MSAACVSEVQNSRQSYPPDREELIARLRPGVSTKEIAVARSFLVLHGVNGSGMDHWQTFLTQRLRRRGETVFYPELSSKEQPDRAVWLSELKEQLRAIPDRGELTVVCHSLACILWMHYAAEPDIEPVGSLILVAPPGPSILKEFRPTFYPAPADSDQLRASARNILLVCTNADPRCPEKAAECYGRHLGLRTVLLDDEAAHINIASGFGDWPEMAVLCMARELTDPLVRQLASRRPERSFTNVI
jgi:predicted alpha/beta hydrolase family esterase